MNNILRFCSERGSELGRLPPDLAGCLAPLLDAQQATVHLQACALPPGGLGIMDRFPLRLSIWLERSAFSEDLAAVAAAAADGSESVAAARRYALSRLLALLHLPPEIAARATEDVAVDSGGAEGGGAASGAGGGGGATGDADGESLSSEQLQSVYHHLGCDPTQLSRFDRPQPVSLISTLHEYQRQGVGWMCERERLATARRSSASGEASAEGNEADEGLPPSWAKYRFCCATPFYVNPSTGASSLTAPTDEFTPRGGILSDEMVRKRTPHAARRDRPAAREGVRPLYTSCIRHLTHTPPDPYATYLSRRPSPPSPRLRRVSARRSK